MSTETRSTPDQSAERPPRPRRWIPLSLRMFAVMIVLPGIASGLWIGVPAYRQHRAIREIERVGGKVYMHHNAPEWMRKFIGNERMNLFERVEYVYFQPDEATFHRRFSGALNGRPPYTDGPTIDDTTLACIARVPTIEQLDLSWTNVSDAGMKHVAGLRNLRQLRLDGTDVSDASGRILADLTTLERLSLRRTKITETGLVQLKMLQKLKYLSIDWNLLTPATLQCLSALPCLEKVNSDEPAFRRIKPSLQAVERALPRVEIY